MVSGVSERDPDSCNMDSFGAVVSPAALQSTMAVSTDLIGVGIVGILGAPTSRVVRELRRQSDSLRAQHLWDAIKAVRAQKQIPAIPRMARYMSRYHGLTKEATQRLLDLGVEDNLIKLENKVGTKGNKSGVEEKAYRLPTADMLPRERHDWYCFHCHTAGEVILCSGCHRVYHQACLKEPLSEENEFFCIICKTLQKVPESQSKAERKDLNHLLGLCINKLSEKMPGNLYAREPPQVAAKTGLEDKNTTSHHKSPSSQQQQQQLQSPSADQKKLDDDETWRARFLLKQMIDFDEMLHKCQTNQYRIAEEFRADAQLIVHNTVIFHGAQSNMADLARQMFRDCTYDLKDIQLCRDCYRYSSEKNDKYWFCKPCRPLHELVYAKQKGFPYWPAKVMRVSPDGMHDVRFFGGYHQRALVEKADLKPITVNIHTLQVKRTALWNKASDELRRHQDLLSRIKNHAELNKDPFGDPFDVKSLKAEYLAITTAEGDTIGEVEGEGNMEVGPFEDEEDEVDLADHPSMRPPRETPPPGTTPLPAADKDGASEPKKKKPGRPKKLKKEEQPENYVSSSSQESVHVSVAVQTPSKLLKGLVDGSTGMSKKAMEKEFKQYAEKMRADFDQEKKRAVNVATRSLERDLERLKADHATEIEELMEKHKQELSDIKKKQWCYNCEAEAIYWCCWNTAYCTIDCQQDHWHKEHKRMCRRKR